MLIVSYFLFHHIKDKIDIYEEKGTPEFKYSLMSLFNLPHQKFLSNFTCKIEMSFSMLMFFCLFVCCSLNYGCQTESSIDGNHNN